MAHKVSSLKSSIDEEAPKRYTANTTLIRNNVILPPIQLSEGNGNKYRKASYYSSC